MSVFPRTEIEGLSLPRLLIGTNWFLGFSHTSHAKDQLIRKLMTREAMADVLEAFFRAGVDCVYGVRPDAPHLEAAIADAEDRTGVGCIKLAIPTFEAPGTPEADAANARILDEYAAIGTRICMPHQCTTDALIDRKTRSIPGAERILEMTRERGMIPGLSTHTPEVPVYADETGLDVATYIQIYNAAGFLMQIEVDWVHRMIWSRAKPVITIKPLAAGRLHPLVGLAFVWATLRPIDMVCIGTMTPDEAKEVVEISLSVLENRAADMELQRTRSKASVDSP